MTGYPLITLGSSRGVPTTVSNLKALHLSLLSGSSRGVPTTVSNTSPTRYYPPLSSAKATNLPSRSPEPVFEGSPSTLRNYPP
jgi:hypothetical protein